MDYTFHWRPVFRQLPDLLEASLKTIEVASFSLVIGIIAGLVLAVTKEKGWSVFKGLAQIWIELARNTPALFQLYFFSFGLGAFGVHWSPYFIVLAGLSFNNAGYLAESFRGGFQAIPKNQFLASKSLGMTVFQMYTRIVIPQVFRIVYFPITNQIVWAVLMSSLGMIVGFRELSGETQFFASKTYRIFEYFLVTAAIYYCIVKIILGLSRLIGWRIFRY